MIQRVERLARSPLRFIMGNQLPFLFKISKLIRQLFFQKSKFQYDLISSLGHGSHGSSWIHVIHLIGGMIHKTSFSRTTQTDNVGTIGF